jgi:hypothetical protein
MYLIRGSIVLEFKAFVRFFSCSGTYVILSRRSSICSRTNYSDSRRRHVHHIRYRADIYCASMVDLVTSQMRCTTIQFADHQFMENPTASRKTVTVGCLAGWRNLQRTGKKRSSYCMAQTRVERVGPPHQLDVFNQLSLNPPSSVYTVCPASITPAYRVE